MRKCLVISNRWKRLTLYYIVLISKSSIPQVAVEQKVPIMMEGWVRAVWEEVVKGEAFKHVSASDEYFLPYTCKPLHGLMVCVSQVDSDTKADLKRMIEENGE